MQKQHKTSHRFVASLLLVLFCLQSCGFNNSIISVKEEIIPMKEHRETFVTPIEIQGNITKIRKG
jgi:hypothetical protein